MKSYAEILVKKDINILITGDSLSFNRYGNEVLLNNLLKKLGIE